MNSKYEFPKGETNIVYVKAVALEDLPDDVQEEVGEEAQLYAVHKDDGEQLALVAGRELAFSLARQNDLVPVTVH
ncbi:DUF1150 family protein [Cognatishimia sp. MH4019]|uniref:DUF1150 family protein n=1 Tax=Cognatishimia sp. MH4019 TaxID=2854030 RepID=UPI001CD228A3|nr:DUF1150 family protein [Cognatishimia sp. MH4019]